VTWWKWIKPISIITTTRLLEFLRRWKQPEHHHYGETTTMWRPILVTPIPPITFYAYYIIEQLLEVSATNCPIFALGLVYLHIILPYIPDCFLKWYTYIIESRVVNESSWAIYNYEFYLNKFKIWFNYLNESSLSFSSLTFCYKELKSKHVHFIGKKKHI